jgi:hypothetical protein
MAREHYYRDLQHRLHGSHVIRIYSGSWAERDGTRHEWAHLLRLRDGMIIDMEDYSSGKRAVRALRRRGALLPNSSDRGA